MMRPKVVLYQAFRSFSRTSKRYKNADSRCILAMFPYPSGRLHMGHMRVYTISDTLARYYRLNGFDVIHPIGWDAFGLPAENAAIATGIPAADWTKQNIEVMREQLQKIGAQFDWDREINTSSPDYYRWTQWIFVKLFDNNLVHRRYASVFWDPVDKTVLAAEQVDAQGRSWRSGALAEKRKLRQWAIETPKYAKRLLDGLQNLGHDWPEVAAIQANWIGKCDVFRFILPVVEGSGENTGEMLDLRIFDPTELERAEFVLVHSDHPLGDEEKKHRYVSSKKCVNFLNGRTLPIVFLAPNEHENVPGDFHLKARLGFTTKSSFDKSLANSLSLVRSTSQPTDSSSDAIIEKTKELNAGGYLTSRILNDWVVSRQRAWGTPIPMVIENEKEDRYRPISADQLPVLLEQRGQELKDGCRIETDTLDTFFDSSWYYLRYLDPGNGESLADLTKIRECMPVDVYVGGIEHADVHLFFARFMSHFLYDIGCTSTPEPFKRLLAQGFVRGQTFVELESGRYVSPSDAEKVGEDEWRCKSNEKSLEMTYEKMSKSKANGIDPLDIIERNGIDLTRLQLLKAAAPRLALNWDEGDLKGLRRWIDRMNWIVNSYVDQRQAYGNRTDVELASEEHESQFKEDYNHFVREISMCLEVLDLHNTAIMRLNGFTNILRKMELSEAGKSVELERCIYALVIMLQAFAPETAQQLWDKLRASTPIRSSVCIPNAPLSQQRWPQMDEDAEIEFTIMMLDTSCCRVTVPRKAIEHMNEAQLIEAAKNEHHKSLFDLMSKRGINVENFTVRRRSGFHITLELDPPKGMKEEHLSEVLKALSIEKARARKEAKKKKREN